MSARPGRVELEEDSSDGDGEDKDTSDDSMSSEEQWMETRDPPPVRSLMLAFMFMFQGYGAMVGNPQHALKHRLNIHGAEESAAFQDATASFQLAKLVMRIAQIGFLVFVQPNGIVYLSFVVMMCALLVPLVFIWGLGLTDLWVVYLQYSLGGVAVGLFEGTFLSVISSLGKNTKTFTIMGAPLGFFALNTVLGTFSYFGMPITIYYTYSLLCLPIAMFIFNRQAPKSEAKKSGKGCDVFLNSMRKAHKWLPKMLPWFIAKFIGNFVLEDGFPLLFNTYNTDRVPIYGPESTTNTVPKALYLALCWFPCMAIGDTISRRLPQYIPLTDWKVGTACLALAAAMCVGGEALDWLKIGIVNCIAVFIANFGNGFIYGLSAKYIDGFIPEEHRYASYNLWCFCGDLGGYAGQSSISVKLAREVCGGQSYTYVCATELPTANATAGAAVANTTAAAGASTAAATTAAVGTATSGAPSLAPETSAAPTPPAVSTPAALPTLPGITVPTLAPLPGLPPLSTPAPLIT